MPTLLSSLFDVCLRLRMCTTAVARAHNARIKSDVVESYLMRHRSKWGSCGVWIEKQLAKLQYTFEVLRCLFVQLHQRH
jgi:hypothetical protein